MEQRRLGGLSGKFEFRKVKNGKYLRESNGRTEQVEERQVNCEQTWKSVYGLEFWEL